LKKKKNATLKNPPPPPTLPNAKSTKQTITNKHTLNQLTNQPDTIPTSTITQHSSSNQFIINENQAVFYIFPLNSSAEDAKSYLNGQKALVNSRSFEHLRNQEYSAALITYTTTYTSCHTRPPRGDT